MRKAWKLMAKECNRVVVELGNEKKREIMGKKKEFREEVFIDDDLTKKAREIQQMLRKMAYEKREKEREM